MNELQRKLFSIVMGLLLIFILIIPAFAHPQAYEHNKELEAVLFEDGYSKYQSDTIKNNVYALEYASYLTIDQFGGNGEDKFNSLRNWRMEGLPRKFSDIDYREDLQGNGKQINANTHRLFTHQGWDREYETSSAKKFWKARRNILLGTVNTIFDFSDFAFLFGYSDKCNSLAGIIYYVHLLGDYDEADNYKKVSLLTDLAGHEDKDNNDMISALESYIEILFEDQKSSDEYKDLMKGLEELSGKAGKLVNSIGGVNTDEEFEEYHQYADELLDLLIEHLPILLKQEKFFKDVFYPELP